MNKEFSSVHFSAHSFLAQLKLAQLVWWRLVESPPPIFVFSTQSPPPIFVFSTKSPPPPILLLFLGNFLNVPPEVLGAGGHKQAMRLQDARVLAQCCLQASQ